MSIFYIFSMHNSKIKIYQYIDCFGYLTKGKGCQMINISILPAGIGDCIWIRYGEIVPYHNIIIDGGNEKTDSIHENIVWKIINKIIVYNEQVPENKKEVVDAIFLTHPDGDHINGILQFFSEASDQEASLIKKMYMLTGRGIKKSFHNKKLIQHADEIIKSNNYEDKIIISKKSEEFTVRDSITLSTLLDSKKVSTVEYLEEGYVIAISKEIGRFIEYDNNADYKKACINKEVNEDGAVLKIISPSKKTIQEFQKKWEIEWEEWNKKNAENEDECFSASMQKKERFNSLSSYEHTIFGKDNSCSNGSSIAFIFEYKDVKIALLGDAFPSVCINGLNKFYTEKVTFDFIKMSHHGSYRNISREFLNSFTTDKFLLSTDGSALQPSKQTFYLLQEICKKKNKHVRVYGNYNWRAKRHDSSENSMFSKDDLVFLGDTIQFINISDLKEKGKFIKNEKGITVRNEI